MTESAAYEQLKNRLKMRLAQLSEDTGRGRKPSITREAIATQLSVLLNGASGNSRELTLTDDEQGQLVAELASEIIGAGPLDPLLADPSVDEIMINGPDQVYVERRGHLERTDVTFRDDEQLLFIIERILDRAGLTITESDPLVDASLPDGTRINVVIPPVTLNGPVVTIRKKARPWTMDTFLTHHTLSQEAADFLVACVKAKVNIVVSGGTSTAKTTLVSVLSAFIPPEERIITIENVAELELPNREHWIRLVAKAPNAEGKGEIPLRSLVRNALRMRPDRIILGEARGGEALDVIQAMTTGHEGVITVLHANSTRSALERLETLMLMSGLELPPSACRAQVASAVDLIVHMMRFPDGSRRISAITQVMGVAAEGFTLEDLFTLDGQGFANGQPQGQPQGVCRYTGATPTFLSKFQFNNVEVPTWVKV